MVTPSASRLLVLMFTDVVGSTDRKSRVGAAAYAALAERHDALFRAIAARFPGAEILKDLGDGFMAAFETASQAVQVALLFQHALVVEDWKGEALRVRIGIHLGEVSELGEDIGGKKKIVGVAADLAARVSALAAPGQILLTGAAFDAARHFVREHPASDGADRPLELKWIAHGPYLFRGVDEPLEVFEVGSVGLAPLAAPHDSEKARRAVRVGEEETLGWRPAIGLEVPARSHWKLERVLGRGGFGEVWLGIHTQTGEARVFKFCFDAERLRSFRRELDLFRVLRETLGDRPDIARLLEVQLETPPYFLESEYCPAGSLAEWAQSGDRLASMSVAERVAILIAIAEALHAAHSVGVLHKDVKPTNVLMVEDASGSWRPQLCDFGIGVLADPERLAERRASSPGSKASTATIARLVEATTSNAGTHLYAPPESYRGEPYRVQGDVYALGVMLYQLAVADLARPLSQGWEREIEDPLLRADIAKAIAGKPEDRFASASGLATALRDLPRRRAARLRARLLRAAAAAALALAVLGSGLFFAWRHERDLRREAEAARSAASTAERRANEEREKALAAARDSREALAFLQQMLIGVHPVLGGGPQVSMREVLDTAATELERNPPENLEVHGSIRNTLGEAYAAVDAHDHAFEQLRMAFELRVEALGPEHEETLKTQDTLAGLALRLERFEEAERLANDVLAKRERQFGPDAAETLVTKNWLARLYQMRGRAAEAEQLYREVLDARGRTLGPDHRETLDTAAMLADFLEHRGQLDEAERTIRDAILRAERAYGPHDELAVACRGILASILEDRGRDAEAETLAREVVLAKTEIFGPEHHETLISKHVHALILMKLSRREEARALLREIHGAALRTFGPDHGSTLAYQDSLGRAEQALGALDEAERLLRDALERKLRLHGEKNESALVTMHNLGLLLLDRKKPADALLILERCRSGLAGVLPADHWMHAAARKNLGDAYFELRQLPEAEGCYLEAQREFEKLLGARHDRTLGAVRALVALYGVLEKPEEKERWQQRLEPGH